MASTGEFIKINSDGTRKLYSRKPSFLHDDGSEVSMKWLRLNENMYPVKEPTVPVTYEHRFRRIKPMEEWEVKDIYVEKKYWFYRYTYPEYDSFHQTLEKKSESYWEVDETYDDLIHVTFRVVSKNAETKKQEMSEQLSNLRWQKEVGGMKFQDDDGSIREIHTDRESQSKMIAAFLLAKDGYTIEGRQWKTPNGFVELTPDKLVTLGLYMQNHVQLCYDNEKRIQELIDNCTSIGQLKTVYDEEFYSDWPEYEFNSETEPLSGE